ncbi:hypothetical protein F5882DRAFT_404248 [Hyaloscypha sp. PMI_1271]|nr:hypothetical protein F5882DRAFT_404248 [Hyaloscypha sp. PMI_1271]
MLDSHSKVGITQIALSIPIVFLAAYILYRNGAQKPRIAWLSFVLFSLIRLAGGIIEIQLENKPSTRLTIANHILLSIGVVPLVLSFTGLIAIILGRDFYYKPKLQIFIALSRIASVPAAVHLIVGGVLIGDYTNKNSASLGKHFVQAAYIVLAVTTAIAISLQVYLWWKKRRLTRNSIIILKALPIAMSFFIVRIAYALVSVYAAGPGSKWNFESVSTSRFACMALLLEYLIAGVFVYIGLRVSNSDNVYGESDALPRYEDLDAKTPQ